MKKIFLTLLFAALAGCAGAPPHIDHRYTASGQSPRVKFIVLHYTALDLPTSLKVLTTQEVSANYLLTDEARPKFYALVDESQAAWHAGVSNWKSYSNLNVSSIGIEIVNLGFKDTPEGRAWYPFKQSQIDELIPLLKQLEARYHIPPENVLGHSDVAPQRKTDPGPMFPWKQLADAGLVTWPDANRVAAQRAAYEQQLPDIGWFQRQLAVQGYAVPQSNEFDEPTKNVIAAFQMKYRQSKFDGMPDAETAAILQVLTTPANTPVAPALPVAVK
ncbi:MAG TPA: N-acetylmuramoyl-L-alanine amidase [Janthinobacterium sp.]|jgi:N-acetylmuramoyl-L-alanine amidase|nr:N-acetylmuramoyl-L-alanine amidase [Janthinobacterium sp.]